MFTGEGLWQNCKVRKIFSGIHASASKTIFVVAISQLAICPAPCCVPENIPSPEETKERINGPSRLQTSQVKTFAEEHESGTDKSCSESQKLWPKESVGLSGDRMCRRHWGLWNGEPLKKLKLESIRITVLHSGSGPTLLFVQFQRSLKASCTCVPFPEMSVTNGLKEGLQPKCLQVPSS